MGDDQKVKTLQQDLKNLTIVMQKFIDEHMVDKMRTIQAKNKSFEHKIDSLEWLSRYANFFSPDNVYLMLTTYKEIYNGSDLNYRNGYIQAQHGSDSVVQIIRLLKAEINKINGGINPN